MAFDDLREQIKEQSSQLLGRIQESTAFQQFKERYDTLSPSVQKIIKTGSIALVILLGIYIPYSFYSSSYEIEETFTYNRDMTRDLLAAESEASAIGQVGQAMDGNALKSRVQSAIRGAQLQPEQLKSIRDLVPANARTIKGIPPNVQRSGITVDLSNLNLNQMLEVSEKLETIDANVKVWSMDVKATESNPLYYDVQYQLVSFYLPQKAEEKKASTRGSRRVRKPPTRRKGR